MDLRKDEMLTTIASNSINQRLNETTTKAFELGASGAFQASSHFDSQYNGIMNAGDYSCLDLEYNNHNMERKLLQEKLHIRESDLNLLK